MQAILRRETRELKKLTQMLFSHFPFQHSSGI